MGASVRPDNSSAPQTSVLTGAQWSGAQSAPVSALTGGDDPGKATTNGLGRTLTGAEWQDSQKKTPSQLAAWKIPALPMPTFQRDATRNPGEPAATRGTPLAPFDIKDPTTYANPILRQVVDPMLAHPLVSAATLAAPFALPPAAGLVAGLGIAGEGVYHIAQYGWQKAAELSLDPNTRKLAEQDPERISGEAAAVQAIMLGLAPLVHAGVKGADFSGGMMEAGASGVKETNFAPRFSEGFQDATDRSRFAAQIERGAAEATPDAAAGVQPPKGLETNAVPNTGKRAVSGGAPEGLIVPGAVKPGKITPLETQPANAPLQEAGDVNAAVRDYQARRLGEDTQDIAEERRAAAERLLGLREEDATRVERETAMNVRRRPQGQKPASFLGSPDGANLLGSVAAQRGLPNDASPYPPTSPLDAAWKAGHDATTGVTSDAGGSATAVASSPPSYGSYPEGFTMGGALTDNRIPSASELPKRARGSSAEPGSSEPNGVPDEERRSLERAANTDDLTGLGNQRAFRKALPAAEADPNTSVIRFDANGFKAVNDTHGHAMGNALLEQIGHAIREQAKDLPAFRVGGDEFAVLAPKEQAEGVRDAIEQAVGINQIEGPHFETGEPTMTRHSISGGIGETDAEADAATKARKTEQKAAQGISEARATPTSSTGNRLTSVEGTGETRTRGLSEGVAQKAIENRLDLAVGELPEYRRLNMADQANRAAQLITDDPELAARVARGEAPAPRGLLPESVFVAVEQRAIEQGDVNTLRELATSRLTGEATTMGQRIRALAERDPESPVAAIQDVVNTRSGGAENRAAAERATNDEVDAIAKHLDAVPVHGNAWNHLIDTLRC